MKRKKALVIKNLEEMDVALDDPLPAIFISYYAKVSGSWQVAISANIIT
jgi:hypothetical protein